MKPFRTNKKDRQTFARVLGFQFEDEVFDSSLRFEHNKILRKYYTQSKNTPWEFGSKGYQRVIQELNDRGFLVYQFPECVELLVDHGSELPECVGAGVSTNTGEALFKAVVAMGEAQK